MSIELIVHPAPRGNFKASWGEREITTARTPLLSSARVLLNEGVAPETVLTMRHAGSSITSMRTTVGEAAKLAIVEDARGIRFRPWEPLGEKI